MSSEADNQERFVNRRSLVLNHQKPNTRVNQDDRSKKLNGSGKNYDQNNIQITTATGHTMNRSQQLIIRYEKARSAVAQLARLRQNLIDRCSITHAKHDYDYRPCLAVAYEEMNEANSENWPDGYSFDEVFDEGFHEDRYCHYCYVSRMIKLGPLAEAKAEFANSKRALSSLGKQLIKVSTNAIR